MNWKQFLTENVLKECWHTDEEIRINSSGTIRMPCYKCGTQGYNRTYSNRHDLLDLYEVLDNECKWENFKASLLELSIKGINDSWIFCFNRKSSVYENRCKMVAAFYGWEEEK